MSTRNILVFLTLLSIPLFSGCDRGANDQIDAARNFSDAVTRNEIGRRDSMIATYKFKEHFDNAFVAADLREWFRTFYDYHTGTFIGSARADVDEDLKNRLATALIDGGEIEETGLVRVKDTISIHDPAIFWMVKQKNHSWKVAMVTKGEAEVHF